jgi:hypothetical protein
MLRKSTVLALTAVAALGLAMTNANAKPGPNFGPKGPINPNFGNPSIFKKPAFKPVVFKPINLPVKPIYVPQKPYPHWHVHYRPRFWYPPVVAAPAVIAAPTYAVSRPVAGPCTCLSKEYTPEGAVLFKDRCTNEMAMNPPPAPQQTGEVEVQQQTAQYQQQYVQPQPQAK